MGDVTDKEIKALDEGGVDAYLEERKKSPPAEMEYRRESEQKYLNNWNNVKGIFGTHEEMKAIVHTGFHDYYNLKVCVEDDNGS